MAAGNRPTPDGGQAQQVVNQISHVLCAALQAHQPLSCRGADFFAMFIHQNVGEARHMAQGCAQIVRHGVAERLQFAIHHLQLRGALQHTLLQRGVQPQYLLFGPLARGDIGNDSAPRHGPVRFPPRDRLGDHPKLAFRRIEDAKLIPANTKGLGGFRHCPHHAFPVVRVDTVNNLRGIFHHVRWIEIIDIFQAGARKRHPARPVGP